jgi:signal peptidase I
MISGEQELKGKEPWLAVNLSSFLTGLGQLYSGRPGRGLTLVIVDVALMVLMFWSGFSRTGNGALVFLLLPIVAIMRIWNLFDAHKCAVEANSAEFEAVRKEVRDPWLAVSLNRMFPGIGQIYLRRVGLGIVFLIASVFFVVLGAGPIVRFARAGIVAIACYHAVVIAPRRMLSKHLMALIIVVIFATLFGALTFTGRYQSFRTPTSSMEPTLRVGDYFMVRKSGGYVPERGDLVVLIEPGGEHDYVKRVVALGGETVQIEDTKIKINGSEIRMEALDTEHNRHMASLVPDKYFDAYVPDGHVFVVGDNLYNSRDSRIFGPVPHENIIGKVFKIYWPIGRVGPVD